MREALVQALILRRKVASNRQHFAEWRAQEERWSTGLAISSIAVTSALGWLCLSVFL